MKTIVDPTQALTRGLKEIRTQFKVPMAFPPTVLAVADAAARRAPTEHIVRTDRAFVTLDPASSTDLDQAFTIDRDGQDLLLHYAIADVAWFVTDGDAIDQEAWTRGASLYLPDGKAPLYPPILSEHAASLLPDGPRPAVIFSVRVAPDGAVKLDGAERAIIRSRAKLAYDSVKGNELPPDFITLSDRIQQAENRRGASRIDPPEQEVRQIAPKDFELTFRPRLPSEDRNAALSLACNLAIADAMLAHHTGLFRVMAPPNDHAIRRLRFTARAFGLLWPEAETLDQFQKSLRSDQPHQAAFMLAARRAGTGASYASYEPGIVPWHAAMAATYVHATAPLRRLADRYVVRAALAIAKGQAVPEIVTEAFSKLPPVMAQADAQSGQIERAVVDLAEAVMLQGREGQAFPAIVTDADERGARIQLRDQPVVARVAAEAVHPGDEIMVRLISTDADLRLIRFERIV